MELAKSFIDLGFEEIQDEQLHNIIGGGTFYIKAGGYYYMVSGFSTREVIAWAAGGAIAGLSSGLYGSALGAIGGTIGVVGSEATITRISKSDFPWASISITTDFMGNGVYIKLF